MDFLLGDTASVLSNIGGHTDEALHELQILAIGLGLKRSIIQSTLNQLVLKLEKDKKQFASERSLWAADLAEIDAVG